MLDQKYDNNRVLIEYVGRRIAVFRKKQNFSQEMLANKMGISSRQLSKYEIGRNRITIDRLMSISEILNIPISSFLPYSKYNMQINKHDAHYKLLNNFSKLRKISAEDLLLKITQLVD